MGIGVFSVIYKTEVVDSYIGNRTAQLMDHSSTVYKSQFMDIGALQGFTKTETDLCIGNKSTTQYQMKQWELILGDQSLTLHKSHFKGIGVLPVIYKTERDLNNGVTKQKNIYISVTKHK